MHDRDLSAWAQRAGIPANGLALIRRVRELPPGRTPRTGTRNSVVRYPSLKMSQVIACESATVELPFVMELEYDDDVIEYHAQPAVRVKHETTVDGRRRAHLATADTFVIRRGAAGWEEYKTESRLAALSAKNPDIYARCENGSWRSPSGEKYAAQFGLSFRVRSDAEIPRRRIRNLDFLEDFLRETDPRPAAVVATRITEAVRSNPGITIARLLSEPDLETAADDLYRLIVAKRLYFDLDADVLAEPDRARVYLDRAAAAAFALRVDRRSATGLDVRPLALSTGQSLDWDGRVWRILNVGDSVVTLDDGQAQMLRLSVEKLELLARDGQVRGSVDEAAGEVPEEGLEIYRAASPSDLETANQRMAAIRPYLDGERSDNVHDTRSFKRHLQAYQRAEARFGWGYLGLIPQVGRRGNRLSSLDQDVEKLIDEVIRDFSSARAINITQAHLRLQAACAAHSLPVPSRQTLGERIKRRYDATMVAARHGRKAAYQIDDFHWVLLPDTPRHGDRPFQVVHIDHTKLSIELVDRQTGRRLGRPWLTLAVDAYTRRCLAVWLTFDPPSYRTVLAVTRMLVRRWARLPEMLVVDGGAEFRSTYLESLAGLYEMRLRHRPKSAARHGSVIERLIGTTEEQVVKQLEGNTKATRNVRLMSPEVDPRRHATWDLATLYELLCWFLYEVYDERPHPALSVNPREAFAKGIRLAGQRPHRLVAYDETFLLATMAQGDRPTATVDPARGIKVGYLHYWAPELGALWLKGKQLPYRIDPWDIRSVRVFVGGQWVNAPLRYGNVGERITERELLIAAQEHRARRRSHTIARRNFERDLIESLVKTPQGKRALQRAADRASDEVRGLAGIDEEDAPRVAAGASVTVLGESSRNVPAEPKARELAREIAPDASPPRRSQDRVSRWYRPGEAFDDYA